jgi:hypothetical protein
MTPQDLAELIREVICEMHGIRREALREEPMSCEGQP